MKCSPKFGQVAKVQNRSLAERSMALDLSCPEISQSAPGQLVVEVVEGQDLDTIL